MILGVKSAPAVRVDRRRIRCMRILTMLVIIHIFYNTGWIVQA